MIVHIKSGDDTSVDVLELCIIQNYAKKQKDENKGKIVTKLTENI